MATSVSGGCSGGFPSGQRGQTVNLMALPSKVRILHPPLVWADRSSKQRDLVGGDTPRPRCSIAVTVRNGSSDRAYLLWGVIREGLGYGRCRGVPGAVVGGSRVGGCSSTVEQ